MINNNRITFRPMRKDDLDSVMVIDRLSFSMPWPESAYSHDLIIIYDYKPKTEVRGGTNITITI